MSFLGATMDERYGKELVRYFSPRFKNEFYIEPEMALDIKLGLERLRLAEMLAELQDAAFSTESPQPALSLAS